MKITIVISVVASIATVLSETIADNSSLIARSNGRTHIGYRVVKKSEVDALKLSGGVAAVPPDPGGRQLGVGVYISPGFRQWPPQNTIDNTPDIIKIYWDCQVTAEPGFWEGLHKAWVPRYYQPPPDSGLELKIDPAKKKCESPEQEPPRPPLWGMFPFVKNINRPRFLQHLDNSFTPANTVLFSKIQDHLELTQALIPQAILNQGRIFIENCVNRPAPENAAVNIGEVSWSFLPILPGRYLGEDV